MSLDLLVKLICIPLALYIVNTLTAAKADQSLSELATSVQYEALRQDVAESTYAESFYDPNKEKDLKSENGVNYATPVSYFDYTIVDELLNYNLNAEGDIYTLLDPNYVDGIRGYADVLIAGGTYIEEEAGFFENALWGGTGASRGTYFSGLSGIGELDKAAAGGSACQPYKSIKNAQSRFKKLISQPLTGALKEVSSPDQAGANKLVEPNQRTNTATSPAALAKDLSVADLAGLVQSTSAIAATGKDTGTVDQCFIAQAQSVLDYDQTGIVPIKQMPNLAYYNYFFSKSDKKLNIEDDSNRFSFLRKSENSSLTERKRERLLEAARESQSKWNAF